MTRIVGSCNVHGIARSLGSGFQAAKLFNLLRITLDPSSPAASWGAAPARPWCPFCLLARCTLPCSILPEQRRA